MNYEDFYGQTQIYEKEIKDLLASQQKIFKRLSKSLEKGDLKSAAKDLTLLQNTQPEYERTLSALREAEESFDAKAYMENGDFAEQMLAYLKQSGVDVKGEHNIFEVFPYKVRLDAENLDVYIDRKRMQCLRPQALANDLKASRDKLMAAAFNPLQFANELAGAYDVAIAVKCRKKSIAADSDLYLNDIYKSITPMRRFRKDYDMQSFAFDLARLNSSEVRSVDDGRMFQFGPSRDNKNAIRVLDNNGHERFLATIRFYKG